MNGAQYLGDEIVFVSFDDLAAEGFPKAATIKQGSFPLFPERKTFTRPVGGLVRFYPPPSREAAAVHAPDLLAFVEYDADAEGTCRRAEPELAAVGLVQQCFGGLGRDPRILGVVARLSGIPAHSIRFSHPRQVKEVLERPGR
jgi:hypothetical protein